MGEPLVTVIICAYNAGTYLKPSLESVLAQSYEHLEILVVDDGSSDGSTAWLHEIQDSRIRVLTQENSGKPIALNRALSEMNGEFYAVHDADDISHPHRIERQLDCFLREEDLAAVFCGNDVVLGEKHHAPRFRPKGRTACRADIENFRMPALDPTGMYRMSKVGQMRYDTSLPVVEGFDYILRVGEQYPIVVLGECLYSYRIHGESITKKDPGRRTKLVWQLRRQACARRGVSFDEAFPDEGETVENSRVRDNGIASHFMESVVDLRGAGRWMEAIRAGMDCARLCPTELHYYKALLYAFMPEWLRRRVRPSERAL